MKTLLAMIAIIFTMLGSRHVYAVNYQLGVDTSKPVSCTNATERTDGTPLPAGEIADAAIRITGPDSYQNTLVMVGGCKTVSLPLDGLAPGDYTMIGTHTDTGGRMSIDSIPVNFTLLPPIPANPNPPTVNP